MQADFAVVGLAVMGQNLALNIESRGHAVAVYNRTPERTHRMVEGPGKGKRLVPAFSMEELVASVARPRRIMLMVQAGKPVDDLLALLRPLLSPGDLVIDGGNSHFLDTIRRARETEAAGLLYLGAGVSGGEEGALHGPSIMPGGSRAGWELAAPVFREIAARVDGIPCAAYIGADGSGHYVKMVHNGIEYGDMELIAEAYLIMKDALGMGYPEMASVFSRWNKGELDSYLIEITADILGRTDPETGRPMVESILDTAGQKGTGKWTSASALDLGVPAPTIAEAVFARCISAIKAERVEASRVLSGPDALGGTGFGEDRKALLGDREAFVGDLRDALYASKICSYAQGFALMRAAAAEHGWTLAPGEIATIWRGGCIIRARFLDTIRDAYLRDPAIPNLLLDPYFRDSIERGQAGWRRVVSAAARLGVPIPAFSSALAYFDSYRTARLPANLIQAQRDYFGAHTYQRVDRPGSFHTEWGGT
jgi:6-phosphogluconate dehydrogenase